MNFRWLAILCLLAAPMMSEGQTPAPPTGAPNITKLHADYSREPFVIEQYVTTARFENDGTGEEDVRVRVRLQSDASVEQWSQLAFGYNADAEAVQVRYVRVRKPDGSNVDVSGEAIKDATVAAVADLPLYSNCKEKRISIPSLAAGDTLEYDVDKRVTEAVAPGEFWFEHRFIDSALVLDERLAITVPAGRKLTLKSSPETPHQTEQAGGHTIYRWTRKNLQRANNIPSQTDAETRRKAPDVQLTTFTNWDAIARWYQRLVQERAAPTPEVRAKAQELTGGQESDFDKAEAIYDYIAKKLRYVNLDMSFTGYKPGTAADILSTQMGDAQDKNALLAAMLRAAGLEADTVLIPSVRPLDASVPSPAQLDRVLTVARIGDELAWMDATMDVVPFGMIPAGLRDKPALLISADGSGKIIKTPADPPFLSIQHVDIDAQLTPLGRLTAHVHYSVRGDTELALRSAFRDAPESQRKEIAQTVLALDGIHGEVTSARCSDPKNTHDPFELYIDFTQSNFVTWSNARTSTRLPMLSIGLPDPPADATKTIDLGSPLNVTVQMKLAVPETFSVRVPTALSLARDFSQFKSSYTFTDHAFTATRSLDFLMRELAASRRDEYLAFERAVSADQNQMLFVENRTPGGPAIPAKASANELAEAGHGALTAGNSQAAIPLLERAVQLEPLHKTAWNDLGLAYLNLGKLDESISALEKHLEINPSDEHANQSLGIAFERNQDYVDAAAAFLKQTQRSPLDPIAHASLGEALLAQHDYAASVPEFEKATILAPGDAQFQESLGSAYAGSGKASEAVAAFEKAATLSPSAEILNAAAFDLAQQKLSLDKAQRFAELAISDTIARLRSINLVHVTGAEINAVEELAADWDTLGWVYFQKGDLNRALPYIRAAWLLSEDGEAGDHLAQIYDKSGDKEGAIHACALALAAPHAAPETRARLTLLLGGNLQIDELVAQAKPKLEALRTIPAGKLATLTEDARADFLVLLSPVGAKARVDAVKFVGGSESLRDAGEKLRSLDFGAVFPDASPAKIVRRGTAVCPKTGPCTFRLFLPEEARSAN